MNTVEFLYHENPSTWAGVEPTNLGVQGNKKNDSGTETSDIIQAEKIMLNIQKLLILKWVGAQLGYISKINAIESIESTH
ncbi:hypothetical protein TNCV_4573761 [Trichonephila clavipes]|nr:hypothetical protein TNCV_4573761 [Trichonephila clavipes]